MQTLIGRKASIHADFLIFVVLAVLHVLPVLVVLAVLKGIVKGANH